MATQKLAQQGPGITRPLEHRARCKTPGLSGPGGCAWGEEVLMEEVSALTGPVMIQCSLQDQLQGLATYGWLCVKVHTAIVQVRISCWSLELQVTYHKKGPSDCSGTHYM
jgi:hypothetical protein